MFGKNIGKREKTLVTICIILGTAAIGHNAVIEPLAANWKMLNQRVEAKRSQLGKNMRLLKMYKTIEAEYINYSEFITSSDNEEEELASVLGKIEEVAKSASCRIANVKPRASKKFALYKEISFTVTAEGSIDEISRFLYSIETSKELLRVKHFTIVPRSGSPDALRGTFVIGKIVVG